MTICFHSPSARPVVSSHCIYSTPVSRGNGTCEYIHWRQSTPRQGKARQPSEGIRKALAKIDIVVKYCVLESRKQGKSPAAANGKLLQLTKRFMSEVRGAVTSNLVQHEDKLTTFLYFLFIVSSRLRFTLYFSLRKSYANFLQDIALNFQSLELIHCNVIFKTLLYGRMGFI